MDFESLNLSPVIYRALENLNFTIPTEIQLKAIPPALAGQHIIGIAQTGTGKTAAFVIPLIMKLVSSKNTNPQAIILVPTKELVVQVHQHFMELAEFTSLKAVAMYGGVGKKTQVEQINEGAIILISTPGRFLELYHDGIFKANAIKMVVLDEADRMMDMGFMPQLRLILDVLPMRKQVMLYSATFPQKVEKLCAEFLDFPVRVEVSPQASTVDTIDQQYYHAPNIGTKLNLIEYLIRENQEGSTMIFAKTRKTVNLINARLERFFKGKVGILHSNKEQNTRLHTLEQFREGELRILVSTDIASRGLDIEGVSVVINFDVPNEYHDYVHRIGRTGRALRLGSAYILVNDAEIYHLRKIEKLIDKQIKAAEIPPEVIVLQTPLKEQQAILREIDFRKQKVDPTYQGAFHRRKPKEEKTKKKNKKTGGRRK